jgi:hypothetical protein
MNIVKVISTRVVSEIRQIKFLRMGKSDVQETEQITPFGIDSNPVKDMIAVYSPTLQQGEPVIVGYINKNQISDVGETRIFSTDENGTLKTFIHLLNDGTMKIGGDADFMVRFNALKSGFDQLKSDFNNHLTNYNTHVHSGVTTGPGTSGPTPSVSTASTASIDSSKIAEIKTI